MWKYATIGILALASCSTMGSDTKTAAGKSGSNTVISTTAPQIPLSEISSEDLGSIVSGSQELGLDIYNEIRKVQDGNIIISPLSISSAFGLAYAGAQGETARQMSQVLSFDLPNDRLHRALGQMQVLAEDETKGQIFDTANTIFFDKMTVLEPEYVSVIDDSYKAKPQAVDFRYDKGASIISINDWVKEQTRGLIPKTVTENDITEDTRSVMVNTAFLKADWQRQFRASFTKTETFYGTKGNVDIPLMNITAPYKFIDKPGFRALELPYKNGTMSALVFLPDDKRGIERFEKSLTSKKLTKWISALDEEDVQRVQLTLPKVDFEFEAEEIKTHLIDLGMPRAFSDDAEFEGRILAKKQPDGWPTKISKVIHKTVLKVDEEGTEAAAVTAIVDIIVVSGHREQPKLEIFRVDHPFFLVIKNNETDAILFMGRIVDPIPDYKAPESESP